MCRYMTKQPLYPQGGRNKVQIYTAFWVVVNGLGNWSGASRHMARRSWEFKSGKYYVNELIGLATKQVDLYVSN